MKDCFKCCVCQNDAGFVPNWAKYVPGGFADKTNITQPLLCKRCNMAFVRWSGTDKRSTLDILAWASKRAREAEHRRMADKVNGLEYQLSRKKG
jgi:hypothetical protein